MELALAGVDVDLYDRSSVLVSQASAQNEGKIHLGYVYAKDPSRKTARLMIEGALRFSPLLRRWIGSDVERVPVSEPFFYAVHRQSQISPEEVERHLRACNDLAIEIGGGKARDYFGSDYRRPACRLTSLDGRFDPAAVAAAFATPEIAIDAAVLAELVRGRLDSEPRIRPILQAEVVAAKIEDDRVEVTFVKDGRRLRDRYDHAVNALWDSRLAVDATAGIRPDRPWLFRIKHYVRVDAGAKAVPSTTIVQGPFGDVVAYPSGAAYLSWYPAGMRQSSGSIRPERWPRRLGEGEACEMRDSIVAGLSKVVPGIANVDGASRVEGGVIFAWGASDIHDPASRLHFRSEVGPVSRGRYHSIDTGKLTLAPLFAKRTADRILAA